MGLPIIKLKPFIWGALSPKQRFIFTWWRMPKWMDKDCIIAEGAIRSGKTVSMALSFVDWATENYDEQNFIMSGKTIQSFRRNVVEPLKKMLLGRGYSYKDNNTKNYLTIHNPRTGHTCYFWVFGGKDEGSSDLVQGITAAGAFFDEAALMPESFVNQATGRCSVDGSKYWFNCNPEGPKHWFKKNWIDKIKSKNGIVIHFNMDDNLTLTERIKERYKAQYSGVFFKRFILGLWVIAEGVIYDMFSESNITASPGFTKYQADRLFISIDYGIQNPMTFGKYGVKRLNPFKSHYHLFESYYHSGRDTGKQKTDEEYIKELEKFIGKDDERISYIVIDPSATSFIAAVKQIKNKLGKPKYKIIPARNCVLDGIALMMNLISTKLFTIDPSCKNDEEEFYAYSWDDDALERGKEEPLKTDDHAMDRNRYATLTDSILFRGYKPRSGRGAME